MGSNTQPISDMTGSFGCWLSGFSGLGTEGNLLKPLSIASATSVRMIWKNNLAGENTFVNGNLLSFVGKTEEEMLGLKWMEIVHPDHREKLLAGWKKAAKLKL